jgi:hypothetical protein
MLYFPKVNAKAKRHQKPNISRKDRSTADLSITLRSGRDDKGEAAPQGKVVAE